MQSIINEIKYNEKNLVPTIVQNYLNGDVLMFAFSNEESLNKIIEIGPEDVNTHSMYIKFGCYPVVTEAET